MIRLPDLEMNSRPSEPSLDGKQHLDWKKKIIIIISSLLETLCECLNTAYKNTTERKLVQ